MLGLGLWGAVLWLADHTFVLTWRWTVVADKGGCRSVCVGSDRLVKECVRRLHSSVGIKSQTTSVRPHKQTGRRHSYAEEANWNLSAAHLCILLTPPWPLLTRLNIHSIAAPRKITGKPISFTLAWLQRRFKTKTWTACLLQIKSLTSGSRCSVKPVRPADTPLSSPLSAAMLTQRPTLCCRALWGWRCAFAKVSCEEKRSELTGEAALKAKG